MWCSHCQADVAGEASADGRQLRCASCGTALLAAAPDATLDPGAEGTAPQRKIHEAQVLLDRWSSSELLDPFGPTLGHLAADSAPQSTAALEATDTASQRQRRKPSQAAASKTSARRVAAGSAYRLDASSDHVSSASGPSSAVRIDQRHGLAQPHIEMPNVLPQQGPSCPTNPLTLAGQILAYSGVLGLTLGTSLFLWAHFGEHPHYAPTGWLITTFGQMLLFLGVITLVSGGMDQTRQEVAQRIDRLGQQILRFDQPHRHHVAAPNHPPAPFPPGGVDDALRDEGVVVEYQSGH